jgi:hypothetical protein
MEATNVEDHAGLMKGINEASKVALANMTQEDMLNMNPLARTRGMRYTARGSALR